MVQNYYRFWSLDPTYVQILDLVQKNGAKCIGELHTEAVLFEGAVYDHGKPPGFFYPKDSTRIIGMDPEPTKSFPARLIITTENLEKMVEIETRFGLDKIPEKYRTAAHPQADLKDFARYHPTAPVD